MNKKELLQRKDELHEDVDFLDGKITHFNVLIREAKDNITRNDFEAQLADIKSTMNEKIQELRNVKNDLENINN